MSSVAFALLYAELGLFLHLHWRARSDSEAAVAIGTAFVVVLLGYGLSFMPARTFTVKGVEQQGSLALPELIAQMGKGAGAIVVVSVICLELYLYLTGFNPVAAYSVLNNIYVFTLAGVGLTHGLMTYVRYGALLYAVKQDSWAKVLSVSGGVGLLILSTTQFLIKLDIDWLNAAPVATQGLIGLHVYGRDAYFFTLALAIYLWHLRSMANH
ncbi:MAG: hypothetical protein HY259_02625 [Chloroflexi bacterium]|nr:hypothetical protein [Chloroflexota bacterium]